MTLEPVYFLLVDDLEENLLALEALLRREGLKILKARSGAEGLELLLKYDIALALVDVQMPGMDGFEMAELMRGTEQTKSVPIIFLTAGAADAQRRFRGYEAGAVDFLQKPIDADVLKSKADVFFELCRRRQEVARQRDELQLATEENTRLLKESHQYADQLKQADHRKDEFLATLAHELRNPLAPLRSGLHALRLNPTEQKAGDVRDMMERQLTHMVRMIDDLLDVARVSQGKIELRKERVTLQSILTTAIEGSKPQIDAAHHTLTVDVPADAIWVEADPMRFAQVIGNLLNNAARYTPEGGRIGLAVRIESGKAVISVTDNGIGIPPDMLHQIFDLFTQVGKSIERTKGGLGIGLALVRQLADMHDAVVTAESAGVDKGSTFTIRLPVESVEQPITPPLPAPASEHRAADVPLQVLVVDDNVDSAQITFWMLEMIGHKPVLAHDGIEALETARNMHPDVILLDIGLPGMNGYDVCREIRKDPAFKNTVLIAQTGWGQKRDREMAHEAGFDHHLVKPVSFDQLAGLLSTIRAAA